MDPNQEFDGRDQRKGQWSWFQNQLLYVLRPLIGYPAAWLYIVMCELVPEKIRNPMTELSIRSISRRSGMGTGTLYRERALLIAVGMLEVIERGEGETPIYSLPDLPTLVALGEDELVRRLLSVPSWNTSKEYVAYKAAKDKADAAARSRAGGGDSMQAAADDSSAGPKAPEGSGGEGVPNRNGSGAEGQNPANAGETPEETGDLFPQRNTTPGFLEHYPPVFGTPSPGSGNALIKTKHLEKTTTPLPPLQGGGAEEPILPFADCGPSDGGFAVSLPVAARWLMTHCAVVGDRHERVFAAALNQRCRLNRETLQQAAKLGVTNFRLYQDYLGKGLLRFPWGPVKFFGQGHWQFPDTWPYDDAKLKTQSEASVGMWRG